MMMEHDESIWNCILLCWLYWLEMRDLMHFVVVKYECVYV